MLAPLMLLLTGLSSCARVELHPIEGTDIVALEEGQVYTAPKEGYFLSTVWFKEVGKAKVRL